MLSLSLIALISVVVLALACEMLDRGGVVIGDRLRLSSGARGALLNGPFSSAAEFFFALIALLSGHPDVGLGMIAGSAIFNNDVIVGVSAILARKHGGLKLTREALGHTAFFGVMILVFALLMTFGVGSVEDNPEDRHIGMILSGGFVLAFLGSQIFTFLRSKGGDEVSAVPSAKKTLISIALILVGIVLVGGACHYLVEASLGIAATFGMSGLFAGMFIGAPATSIPDMILAGKDAVRGDGDASVSNAQASNSFDFAIAFMFIVFLNGGVNVNWAESMSLVWWVVGSAALSLFMGWTGMKFSVLEGSFNLIKYALFIFLFVTSIL